MQREITQAGPLLNEHGSLTQVGWSRFSLLDCKLERAGFYAPPFHLLQFVRLKRWDYYALFTPRRFFSATIADLGYAGNIFVYTLDFNSKQLHEEGLVIPPSQGVVLPRNSTEGDATFADARAGLSFHYRTRLSWTCGGLAGFRRRSGYSRGNRFALPAGARVHEHCHPHRAKALLLHPQDQLPAG